MAIRPTIRPKPSVMPSAAPKTSWSGYRTRPSLGSVACAASTAPIVSRGRKLPAMSDLLSAAAQAHAASSADWVARWTAIASLLVSFASVIVTVSLWRRDGWRVTVYASGHTVGDGTAYIQAVATNKGRLPGTVADLRVELRHGIGGLRGRRSAVLRNESERPGGSRQLFPKALAPTEELRADFTADTAGMGRRLSCKATVVVAGHRQHSRRSTFSGR